MSKVKSIIDDLNDQQREAVINIDRPVLVIAGAGSGKTKTITHKMAYLLEYGINPEAILAFTFTRNAANEMKKRVSEITKTNLNWIQTFHSFCYKILRDKSLLTHHQSLSERLKKVEIAETNQTLAYVRDILDEMDWEIDAKEMRDFISYVKRSDNFNHEDVIREFFTKNIDVNTVEKVKKMIKRSNDKKDKETFKKLETLETLEAMMYLSRLQELPERFITVFREYQKRLEEEEKVDFDDLQIYAVRLLEESKNALVLLRSRFKHILVDEYQDTDAVQYRLFKLLVGDKDFTVVGDPNQSIYGWRNAKVENILSIDKEFRDVKVIKLERNYRSTKAILEVANKVAQKTSEKWSDKIIHLYTDRETDDKVILKAFLDSNDEADYIVKEIKEKYTVKYSDFAILIRSGYQSEPFERALSIEDIPYVVKSGINFYTREEIEVIVSYITLALNTNDKVAFERTINFPSRKVRKHLINTIERKHYSGCWIQAVKDYIDANLNNLKLSEYISAITSLQNDLKSLPLYKAVKNLIENIALIDYIENRYISSADDRIKAVNKLLDVIKDKNFSAEEFLRFVEKMKKKKNNSDAVVISTIHAAKGLEYDTVFVVDINEEVMPHSTHNEEDLDEEWRVFYVAITRAKNRLFLCYSAESQRSRFLDYLNLKS